MTTYPFLFFSLTILGIVLVLAASSLSFSYVTFHLISTAVKGSAGHTVCRKRNPVVYAMAMLFTPIMLLLQLAYFLTPDVTWNQAYGSGMAIFSLIWMTTAVVMIMVIKAQSPAPQQ